MNSVCDDAAEHKSCHCVLTLAAYYKDQLSFEIVLGSRQGAGGGQGRGTNPTKEGFDVKTGLYTHKSLTQTKTTPGDHPCSGHAIFERRKVPPGNMLEAKSPGWKRAREGTNGGVGCTCTPTEVSPQELSTSGFIQITGTKWTAQRGEPVDTTFTPMKVWWPL
jgi:hypothetical protein